MKLNWISSALERRKRKVGGSPFAMASGSWISVSLCFVVVRYDKKFAYLHVLHRGVVSSIFVCGIPGRGKCVGRDA